VIIKLNVPNVENSCVFLNQKYRVNHTIVKVALSTVLNAGRPND
jgi:hypothetical protein